MFGWVTKIKAVFGFKSAGLQGKKSKRRRQESLNIKSIDFESFAMMGESSKKHDCQDTICIFDTYSDSFYFFGILDGHGSSGREVSNHASERLQKHLESNKNTIKNFKNDKQRENFLRKMYLKTDKELKKSGIDIQMSGTTCISIFIQNNILYISNVGDSRAVLGRVTENEKYAIELSQDHTPLIPHERDRIIKSGGTIQKMFHRGEYTGPYRVWADEEGPGIAMTRSLGDFSGKKIGLIASPEIQHLEIKEYDKFVVCASDGIWDVMTSTEVVAFLLRLGERKGSAEELVKEARSRWRDLNLCKKKNREVPGFPDIRSGIDDISVVVAYFNYEDDQEVNLEDNKVFKFVRF